MRGFTALTLAIALVVAACGGTSTEDTTATTGATPPSTTAPSSTSTTQAESGQEAVSSDGRLSLQTGPGEPAITITEIDAADASMEGAYEVLGSYDLGPDGTEFTNPVAAEFDTGLAFAQGDPIPLLAIALENEAGEYEALSATVDLTGPTIIMSAEIPHFSKIVMLGSPASVFMEPMDIVAPVGTDWYAEWGIYDSRLSPLTNTAARLEYRRESYDGTEGLVPIQPLIDGITIEAFSGSDGAVETLTDSSISTYAYLPDANSMEGDAFTTHVEVFWGDALFGCEFEGSGDYGFDMTVHLAAGSVAFGKRLADGRAVIVVPSGGADIYYLALGYADCVESRYRTTTSLTSQFLRLRPSATRIVIDGHREDGMHDGIWSKSDTRPGIELPHVDMWDAGTWKIRQESRVLDPLLNYSVFECGETTVLDELDGVPVTTICTADTNPIPEGDIVMAIAAFSGPIPVDGDGSEYVYSAVFDSNGDPTDDWQYQGDFDWDFFRDTDRWYQVFIHGDGTLEMAVSDTIGPNQPSGARALIYEDTVMWLIPMGEFSGDNPRGRLTSFVHDGTFNPETGMGDVIGADPTEPLLELVDLTDE